LSPCPPHAWVSEHNNTISGTNPLHSFALSPALFCCVPRRESDSGARVGPSPAMFRRIGAAAPPFWSLEEGRGVGDRWFRSERLRLDLYIPFQPMNPYHRIPSGRILAVDSILNLGRRSVIQRSSVAWRFINTAIKSMP
jgi:hypothetical protein